MRGDIALEMPCYVASYSQWDDALNQAFKTLLNYEDTEEDFPGKIKLNKEALTTAQQSWDKFRKSEKEFLSAFYQSLEGKDLLAQPIANSSHQNLVKHRTYDMVTWCQMHGAEVEQGVVQLASKELNLLTQNSAATKCGSVSTAELLACGEEAVKANDQLLNENYQKLKGTLSNDLQAKLLTTQKAWLKFRDDELAAYDENFTRELPGINADIIYRRAVALGEFAKHASW